MAHWFGIHMPMQGTRVRSLVQEDPTCHGATKPMSHRKWACNHKASCEGFRNPDSTCSYYLSIYQEPLYVSFIYAVLSRSAVSDSFATPSTLAYQAPLSMGILQARLLEWMATPSFRASSRPRDGTQVFRIAGKFFSLHSEPPGKPQNTGVGSLSLLQGFFLSQEWNQGLLPCRWIPSQLSHQGSPLWSYICLFVHLSIIYLHTHPLLSPVFRNKRSPFNEKPMHPRQ